MDAGTIVEGVKTVDSIKVKMKAISAIIIGLVVTIVGAVLVFSWSPLYGSIITLVGIIIFVLGIWRFKNSRRIGEKQRAIREFKKKTVRGRRELYKDGPITPWS